MKGHSTDNEKDISQDRICAKICLKTTLGCDCTNNNGLILKIGVLLFYVINGDLHHTVLYVLRYVLGPRKVIKPLVKRGTACFVLFYRTGDCARLHQTKVVLFYKLPTVLHA